MPDIGSSTTPILLADDCIPSSSFKTIGKNLDEDSSAAQSQSNEAGSGIASSIRSNYHDENSTAHKKGIQMLVEEVDIDALDEMNRQKFRFQSNRIKDRFMYGLIALLFTCVSALGYELQKMKRLEKDLLTQIDVLKKKERDHLELYDHCSSNSLSSSSIPSHNTHAENLFFEVENCYLNVRTSAGPCAKDLGTDMYQWYEDVYNDIMSYSFWWGNYVDYLREGEKGREAPTVLDQIESDEICQESEEREEEWTWFSTDFI